jgi:hypothetical protein
MSFLMMAFGSYGFSRKDGDRSTSRVAFAILFQRMGLRLSKPIFRHATMYSFRVQYGGDVTTR